MSQKTYSTHNNTADRLLCVVLCSIIISTYLVSFVNYDVFADHHGYQPLPSLKEQKNGTYPSLLSLICEDGMQLVVRDNDKSVCLTDDTVSKNPDWIKKVIPQDDRLNDIKWCYGINHNYYSEEQMLEYTEEMNIKPNTIAFSSVTFIPHVVFQMCAFIPQFNTDPNIRNKIDDGYSGTVKADMNIWSERDLGGIDVSMFEYGNNTGVFTANVGTGCNHGIGGGRVLMNCNNVSWVAADIEYDDFESDIEYDDFESGPIFAWTVPQP